MSLLDAPSRAHAPALKRFTASLRAGGDESRAVLLNLLEEDRMRASDRAAFQAKLATSKRRAWKDRFTDAAGSFPRLLPLATPRPPAVRGAWYTHVTLRSLLKHGYVAPVHTGSLPPRRVALVRPLGRARNGMNFSTWISSTTGPVADDVRDTLGLWFIGRDEELYRVRFGVETAPLRALYKPTALDAGWYPAWRLPHASHLDPWGMTRHLQTDAHGAPELLALPHFADERVASHVGLLRTAPPRGFLAARPLP
jgi:hypothetical protein